MTTPEQLEAIRRRAYELSAETDAEAEPCACGHEQSDHDIGVWHDECVGILRSATELDRLCICRKYRPRDAQDSSEGAFAASTARWERSRE